MKKIKVLVDAHVLDGFHQGTCSYISGLYSALSKFSECDIFIATHHQESVEKYFDKTANISWVQLKSKNKYKRLSTEFDNLERKIKPDYSHFQYITPIIKNNKWINTIHDVLFLDYAENFNYNYRIKNYFLFKIGAKRADILTTVSEYSRKRISHHFNVDAKDITVIPNAVDNIESIAAKPVKQLVGKKFYLYVSRFEPRKNQHLLIESFLESSCKYDSKLVLVGSPSLSYPQLDKFLNNGLSNIVHLQGIDMSEVVWLYQNAIASLYPSKGEGFGIPPLEAVALQCPSYSANNTALAELAPFLNGTFENSKGSITKLFNQILSQDRNHDMKVESERVINTFNWHNSARALFKELVLKNNQ